MNRPEGAARSRRTTPQNLALRLTAALAATLALTLAGAGPAPAHQGNPDFRSVIDGIEPAALAPGLEAEVVNFDDHVVLTNESGEDVLILGYEGEPYARIGADGLVEVNLNSPTHYLNEDRFADVALPERADEEARPAWQEVDRTGRFEWHDHRSHYMSEGVPPQVEDESARTKVFGYRIPIEVGGRPARIEGTLFWQGRETGAPVLPFVLLGLVVAAGAAFLVIRRRRQEGGGHDGDGDGGEDDGQRGEAW